jgi:hypothetical protein
MAAERQPWENVSAFTSGLPNQKGRQNWPGGMLAARYCGCKTWLVWASGTPHQRRHEESGVGMYNRRTAGKTVGATVS